MSILSYILLYLLIGVLFSLFIDLGNERFNNSIYREKKVEMNNLERTLLILIWPFGMYVFLRELYKNMKR
jgi:hypothetical protein